MAHGLEIPSTFVETSCFWCRDDRTIRDRLRALEAAALDSIVVSANPLVLEHVPFETTQRAARIGRDGFRGNAIVYQAFSLDQFRGLGLKGTLSFSAYLERVGHGL